MPWWYYLVGGVAGLAAMVFFVEMYIIFRVRLITKRLLTDAYKDNLYGMLHSAERTGVENIIELSLRAERGKVLKRPMGSIRNLPDFSGLAFDQPNLAAPLIPTDVAVDMRVTLGPQAKRPLDLNIPLLISGMGYGVGVSFKTKMAWAKAATLLGTATNSGEGPYLREERQNAGKFIVQYSRVGWTPDEAIRVADMVEIQIGQGVSGAVGHVIPEKTLRGRAGRMFKVQPGEKVVGHSHLVWHGSPIALPELVQEVRKINGEVPVGVKLGAGPISLERDMELSLEAGVDFITIDGMNAATSGEMPILTDDFGLPTILALLRAVAFLSEAGLKGKVSLIISGGLFSPGDCLKALALGADAVGLGTTALLAAAHNQGNIALPWEPIGSINWYQDIISHRLRADEAADYTYNFIHSTVLEMEEGLRTIGRTSLKQITAADLRSITPEAYRLTGIAPAFSWER